MRRLRTIIAAAFLLIGFIYLYSEHQAKLPEGYRVRIPYLNSAGEEAQGIALEDLPQEQQELLKEYDGSVKDSGKEHITGVEELNPDNSPKIPNNDPKEEPIEEPKEEPKEQVQDSQAEPSEEPEEVSDGKPKVNWEFQKELELDLPLETFKGLVNNKPHNYNPNGPKTNAYATFLSTHNPSFREPYYLAIHSLIYRILWSPQSGSQKYPFVVYVAHYVPQEQRELLIAAGAIVRELDPLEWNPNVEGVFTRWKDLFAKLNMWKETEFDKILFLDADAFPVENVDEMFDIAKFQECIPDKLTPDDHLADGTPVCEPYVFTGVPGTTDPTDLNVNVGTMVFSPSERMHQRLLQNYVKTDRYNCKMAEQAFLNWQFNALGAFPVQPLERTWGGFFPQVDEEGKLKVVHEKIWAAHINGEKPWLKKEWDDRWEDMMNFYASEAFANARAMDGVNA